MSKILNFPATMKSGRYRCDARVIIGLRSRLQMIWTFVVRDGWFSLRSRILSVKVAACRASRTVPWRTDTVIAFG